MRSSSRLSKVRTGTKTASAARWVREIREAEALGEGADADRQEIGHREEAAHNLRHPGQRRHRDQHAGKHRRRQDGQNGGAEQRRDLSAGKGRNQHAVGGRRGDVDQRAKEQGRKASLERHSEDDQRHHEHQCEIDHRHRDVGQLLAQQKFDAGDRGHVEIGDRAEFLFADDRERHQDRRKQRQLQRECAGTIA